MDEILDDGGEWWFKKSMKIKLFALFIALLMVGCGSPDLDDPETLDKILADAIDRNKLQKRGKEGEELLYAPTQQTPYTGWVKSMCGNGKIRLLSLYQYKDGKLDGLSTGWWKNGQKEFERNYKDGKEDGLQTRWYENGKKKGEANAKDGEPHGLVLQWHENGQKDYEGNFKDGKWDGPMNEWYENGKKKGEGNYKDGKLDGLHLKWYKNGQKKVETNYKIGELNGLKSWHENGQKKFEGNFKDGKVVEGSRKYWNSKGEEIDQEEGEKMLEKMENEISEDAREFKKRLEPKLNQNNP